MSFEKFIDYLSLEKNYSQNTIIAYQKDLNDFAVFAEEEFELTNIVKANYSIIRSWIVYLVEGGISNRSINRKISSLKTYYKFLLKTKQIEATPLAQHKALKTSKKLQIPFSEKEIEDAIALLDQETGFEGLRNKLVVELFYATGIRRTELVNLKINDVSISRKNLKVLGKRNKERLVPLFPSIIQTVKQYMVERNKLETIVDHEFLLLSSKGVKIYETLVYRVVNNYFSKTSEKVKKSPHILRHSFATHLLNQGADINAVKELLGHASLASTQVYTHNSIAQLKKVYQNSHPRNLK